jgi:hypothetical protein
MKKNIAYTFFGLMALLAFSACSKTEYEQLKRPYNDIERFAIAGYGGLDSIPAVISNDTIFIYWNPDATPPEKITPAIAVSPGASILPASGTQVAFADTTTFTVTGEDGAKRKYVLKPVFNLAIPTLFSTTTNRTWSATAAIVINGEYFLSTKDKKDVRVYAQRVRDGFEYDLTIDTATLTSTRINAYLPKFTSDMDTGAHRIYIKVGNFASNVAPIYLSQPPLSEIISFTKLDRIGNFKLGESVDFEFIPKDDWKVAFEKYYVPANFNAYSMGLQKIALGQSINGRTYALPAEYLTVLGVGKFRIKLDPAFFTEHVSSRLYGGSLSYKNVNGINGGGGTTNYQFAFNAGITDVILEEVIYATLAFQQEGQQVSRGQQLTINYTFTTEAYRTTYAGKALTVHAGFRDPKTGAYTFIENATVLSDNGSQVTFTIPATAATADAVGKELAVVGINFRGAAVRTNVLPRQVLTNTTIKE